MIQRTLIVEFKTATAPKSVPISTLSICCCQIIAIQANAQPIVKLGEILVRQKLISNTQLMQALANQLIAHKKLGELLITNHVITEEQLKRNLANQRIKLGKVLIQKRLVTWKQLHEALAKQAEASMQLGQLLVETGYISEGQLSSALQEQYWRQNGYWVID